MSPLPTHEDVRAAAARLLGRVVRTPMLRHPVLDALSGGMKRKLQVALALLGDSRVVLLGGASPLLHATLHVCTCLRETEATPGPVRLCALSLLAWCSHSRSCRAQWGAG